MFRNKGWFSGGIWKPKNPHSLEHLKYLYQLLSKNQNVTEQNKSLLVETLRLIAEILIWGDQNDSTVFDFFLEKNMLSFFLRIMKQKCGRYVCVQLLQTLNILFENIRNETSLYYLLSNNHVNSIIVHKFDFSDEEVMAYYISFLKTLSLKLNSHTIHFFYNEHTNDFPLYTEAIKFFNHSESMVRIAVRTLTLNVFKVEDRTMLKFIRDKTAAPYFSNLVWFIGNHVLELDNCVRSDAEASQQGQGRLSDLVAEHLDHLHYMNDILCLGIDSLNDVLSDHLLNRLLVPLYVYSLTKRRRHSQIEDDRPHVSSVVSFFLLSQVFLIISHQPLVQQLAHIILNRDMSIFYSRHRHDSASTKGETNSEPEFVAPEESLEKSLESTIRPRRLSGGEDEEEVAMEGVQDGSQPSTSVCLDAQDELPETHTSCTHISQEPSTEDPSNCDVFKEPCTDESLSNITDEEKFEAAQRLTQSTLEKMQQDFSLAERPFLEAIFNALECTENDHTALFALCLLYALGHNAGINQDLLDSVLMPTDKSETKQLYNVNLVERLIKIIALSCQYNSKVRLATLQMSLLLMKQLVVKDTLSFLEDRHLAAVEQAREESTMLLRNFYKSEEIFLDMFEDEYQEMKKKPLNVEYLMMDANLLLPPMGTPMSGVGFDKRLPCGEVERARKTIRVFFLLRDLSLALREEEEQQLPLTRDTSCVHHEDILDLNNSDLLACTVVSKDGQKVRRFMVIDVQQLILVEPDTKRIGWGVTKFVGFLQDIEVAGDKDDSRCLHITVHRPAASAASSSAANNSRAPLLAARFVFDDNIRCMAAKQRLTKGRLKARQRKMHQIARLLELPEHIQPCPSPLRHGLRNSTSSTSAPTGNNTDVQPASGMHRSHSQDTGLRGQSSHVSHSSYRPFFSGGGSGKVPGFATALSRVDGSTSGNNNTLQVEKHSSHHHHHHHHHHGEHHRRVSSSPSGSGRRRSSAASTRSRETSPRVRTLSSSEEIPLEDLSRGKNSSSSSRHGSPGLRRRSSMGLPQARISAPPYLPHPPLSSPSNVSHLPPGSSADNDEEQEETDVFQDTMDIRERSSTILPVTRGSKTAFSDSDSERECTKPCCAGEHHDEKERGCHAGNDSTVQESRTSDGDAPLRRPTKQRKSKGAIQTV